MIGQKQRGMFLLVGGASFLLGLLLLIVWRFTGEFALLVMGPCFMLTGVTWTVVIMLAFKYARIPYIQTPLEPPLEPQERTGGRVRLSESGFVDPVHCFCEVPNDEMKPWVTKRYIDHVPTMQLLQSTDDPHTKEVISLVAMLDVDTDTLLNIMSDVDMSNTHIMRCRAKTRRMLGLEQL